MQDGYGKQDNCMEHKDMWGQIQEKVKDGWFVPSRAEWSAFAEELGIDTENYADRGLSEIYWSSTQLDMEYAFGMFFNRPQNKMFPVSNGEQVRLGAIF